MVYSSATNTFSTKNSLRSPWVSSVFACALWDKVDEAYFNLPDDYDFDNYDEVAFIRSLSFLTDAEKDALIADYNRLTEIDSRLCELYNSIWGNTGCESGICPL